ncbi:MAG: TRAP transporter large permease subunit, partial [Lachnospiraceae bacterium]|nr:TRAP transporter large permease subunit [Lachnospiraceae bacterium]
LGHVNILLSAMMGGLSGSCAADAAQECKILVPEMVKKGYDKPFCATVTAASSLITCIIPPSIGLVVYAYCTDTSVGKMLAAGYMPGILMTLGLMLLVAFLARKRNYPPSRDKHADSKEIIHGIGAAGDPDSRSALWYFFGCRGRRHSCGLCPVCGYGGIP